MDLLFLASKTTSQSERGRAERGRDSFPASWLSGEQGGEETKHRGHFSLGVLFLASLGNVPRIQMEIWGSVYCRRREAPVPGDSGGRR